MGLRSRMLVTGRSGHYPGLLEVSLQLPEWRAEKEEAYPEAVAEAHAGFAELRDADDISRPAESASAARTTRSRPKKQTSDNDFRPSPTRTWRPPPANRDRSHR